MKVNIIKGEELTKELTHLWLKIQLSDPKFASPFFCSQFISAVANVRDDVYIAVLEEENKIIGFFPFQKDKKNQGKPVGMGVSDYQGVILRKGKYLDVKKLIKGCGMSRWEFDHLLISQKEFEPYYIVKTISPIIDLRNGYETYKLEKHKSGSKLIPSTDAKLRKLLREKGPVHFEIHVDDLNVLHQLMQWKKAQYLRTGHFDNFSLDWIVNLLEVIHSINNENFSGLLSAFYCNGELIAAHMGMRSRTVWHMWFSVYNVAYFKYSPGLILRLKIAEWAESLGISIVDMGKVTYPYKRRLMNNSIPIAEGVVTC